MGKKMIAIVSILILSVVFYTQLSIFVVQPVGGIPEGRTVVMLRLNKTEFIDSADAMCEREMGSVTLLCRGMMIGAVAKNGTVLLRLPYIGFLYDISTGGKKYKS